MVSLIEVAFRYGIAIFRRSLINVVTIKVKRMITTVLRGIGFDRRNDGVLAKWSRYDGTYIGTVMYDDSELNNCFIMYANAE